MQYAVEKGGEDPKFTKHPATWLNKGCWRDEPAPQSAPANGSIAASFEKLKRDLAGGNTVDEMWPEPATDNHRAPGGPRFERDLDAEEIS